MKTVKGKMNVYNCGGKLNELIKNIQTWRENKGFNTGWGNVMEKLMLTVTELSEAAEAYRKIPFIKTTKIQFPDCREDNHFLANFREELADAAIRIFDLASSCDIDLEAEIERKMKINEDRPRKHGKNL